MTPSEARALIAELDEIEARARAVEGSVTRIRRRLQDRFHVKCWDYDPDAKTAAAVPETAAVPVGGC